MGPDLKRTGVAVVAVVACLSAARAADRIFFMAADRSVPPTDLEQKLPSDALNFAPYPSTPHSESLFFQFSNPDGTDFFTHIVFIDLGFSIRRCGIDFKIRHPDGRTHYFGRQMGMDECSISGDRFYWRLGSSSVGGSLDSLRLRVEEDGAVVDVALDMVAPVFRAGENGMIYLDPGRRKWGQMTYFTCFTAKGKLTDGGEPVRIDGWGYGDYVRGNFLVTEFTRFCSGLRFYRDGVGFDFIDYLVTEEKGGGWFPVLIVHRDGRIVHVSLDCEKTVTKSFIEPKTGMEVPTDFTIKSAGPGASIEIEFKDVALADYNDPMIVLGPVERFIVNIFTDAPLDLRLDGKVSMKLTTQEGALLREGDAYALVLMAE